MFTHFPEVTKGNLNIRPAGAEDAGSLSGLAGRLFRETYAGEMPEEDLQAYIAEAFSLQATKKALEDETALFLLADLDGQPAGYCKLNMGGGPEEGNGNRSFEMERLYLLQKYQGLKGGAALMQYCLDLGKRHAYDFIWLMVWEKNSKAIAFYEKWGFVPFGSRMVLRGNDPQKGLLMKRHL